MEKKELGMVRTRWLRVEQPYFDNLVRFWQNNKKPINRIK